MALLPGNIGPAIGAPLAAPPGPQPPAAVEENKGLWRGFFEKMKTDPNFRTAMLQTGISMMRSKKMGETGFDLAAEGIGAGVQTLDMLRERDRSQTMQSEEMARKADLEERGQKTDEAGVAHQQRQADTAANREAREATEGKSAIEHSKALLEEASRHNKEVERTGRISAGADVTRANAYSAAGGAGGGRTPQEIQKIDNLTAAAVQGGADPVEARAAATREVMATSRTGSLMDNVDEIVKLRSEQYMFSEDAKTKPMTMEMLTQWRQEAVETVRNTVTQFQGGGTPTPAAAPGPTTPPKANVKTFVDRQRKKGVDDEVIRQHLIKNGDDPSLYGL